MKLEHFIESQQLDKETLFLLFNKAERLRVIPSSELDGKILLSLFYEPSTRTRLSFESAMIRMGGHVLTTENAREFSSAVKGESLEDTIRAVESYADCVVIRHYEEGAAKRAADLSKVPVINGGDGKGQHPTQALLDMYTIYRETGRMDDLKVVIVGDLLFGRTVRSLAYLIGKFCKMELTFVSPDNLRMGDDIKNYLVKHEIKFSERKDLDRVLPEADVIYMTRVQKERMSITDYEKAKGRYVIDENNFYLINKNSIIMHPLPHNDEVNIPFEIEKSDKRVAYYRQVENGLYIRMALLSHLILSES